MKSQSVMIPATGQVFNEAPRLSFVYFYSKISIVISREEADIYGLILLPLHLLKTFLRLDLTKLTCYKYYLNRKVLEMVKDGCKEIMRCCFSLIYITQILVQKLKIKIILF